MPYDTVRLTEVDNNVTSVTGGACGDCEDKVMLHADVDDLLKVQSEVRK